MNESSADGIPAESPCAATGICKAKNDPLMKIGLASRSISEFIGTFILVFAGCGAIVINEVSTGSVGHIGISLTFGLTVMAVICAIGKTSGAHINPAVSVAFFCQRQLDTKSLLAYLSAQLAGAIGAAAFLKGLFPDSTTLGETLPNTTLELGNPFAVCFALEIVLTFVLMFVILQVASQDSALAPLAIGGVVGLEAMFAGPICGASMNPARSIGPALININFESLWIYIFAPLMGACLAIPVFRITSSEA